MNKECAFGFADLYRAAFGVDMRSEEQNEFSKLPQEHVNELVSRWARIAHWHTEERMGTDGKLYIAFWKE